MTPCLLNSNSQQAQFMGEDKWLSDMEPKNTHHICTSLVHMDRFKAHRAEGRKKLQESISVICIFIIGAPKSCFQKGIPRTLHLNHLFLLSTHRAILNNLKFQRKNNVSLYCLALRKSASSLQNRLEIHLGESSVQEP